MKLEKIPRIPGPPPKPVKRSALTAIGKALKSFRLLLDRHSNMILGVCILGLYGTLAHITYEARNGMPLRGEWISMNICCTRIDDSL